MTTRAKRFFVPILLLLGVAVFFVLQVGASNPAPSSKSAFITALKMDLDRARSEVMELENAMPQDKFTWRPEEGVRSVSEVYLHIANANYLFLGMAGIKTPEDMKTLMSQDAKDKPVTDKAKIAEELKTSFDWAMKELDTITDADLDKQVKFFGGQKAPIRSVLLTLATHCHEHLGQSIAYARMNHIVPPWTARQQAQAKKGM